MAEKCEWKWIQSKRKRATGCGKMETTSAHPRRFAYKFCPFCGKRIKEVDDVNSS